MKKVVLLVILAVSLRCSTYMQYCMGGVSGVSRVEHGKATWYGKGFHGKRTASGEIYNMYDLTAAHRTLPFDTQVEVTNLENGKRVVVRVNDRGPVSKRYVIDLSYGAAEKINMIRKGVVDVRLRILP